MGFSGKSTGSEVKLLNRVQLFATPWTVAYRAPLSMGFSRQEYWSGLPFPPPGDLPDPGIGPRSPARQAGSLPAEPPDDIIFSMFRKQERNVLIESESESEVAQSCPTLCDPVDCSLPGSSAHGILQARVLE